MKFKKKSRIIIIGSIPPPLHGSNIYLKNFLNSKIQNEFEIFHLDTSDHRGLDNIGKLDLRNLFLAAKNILQLTRYLIFSRSALVYVPIAQNTMAFLRDGLFIIISNMLSNAKIVIHLHGGDHFKIFLQNANFMMRWFIKYTLHKVDTAIVLGERLRSVFQGFVKQVQVAPNGTLFNPDVNGKYEKFSNKTIQIGYLGNLFKSKGMLDVLSASSYVIKKYPSTQFRFAGSWWNQEPDTEKEAYHFIEQNLLRDQIKFVGTVTGEIKERFLVETDIFVFPSWYPFEGLPIVILEAMAAGCPIIATRDVGVIPEVVLDGVTGILVDKQNPQQIAESIIRLIENPELRISMGKAGRQRFKKHYTMDQNIEKMITIFKNTLNK